MNYKHLAIMLFIAAVLVLVIGLNAEADAPVTDAEIAAQGMDPFESGDDE